MARTWSGGRTFLVGGGILYLGVWIYGLVVADNPDNSNFLPLNDADNWLHLGLGALMVLVGLALGRPQTAQLGDAP
jgi:hypothetical protein